MTGATLAGRLRRRPGARSAAAATIGLPAHRVPAGTDSPRITSEPAPILAPAPIDAPGQHEALRAERRAATEMDAARSA